MSTFKGTVVGVVTTLVGCTQLTDVAPGAMVSGMRLPQSGGTSGVAPSKLTKADPCGWGRGPGRVAELPPIVALVEGASGAVSAKQTALATRVADPVVGAS